MILHMGHLLYQACDFIGIEQAGDKSEHLAAQICLVFCFGKRHCVLK